jgi:hypothetical protein
MIETVVVGSGEQFLTIPSYTDEDDSEHTLSLSGHPSFVYISEASPLSVAVNPVDTA